MIAHKILGLDTYELHQSQIPSTAHILSWQGGIPDDEVVYIAEAAARWAIYLSAKQVADLCEFNDAIHIHEVAAHPLRLADYPERTFIDPKFTPFHGADERVINPAWEDAEWELRFAYRGAVPPKIGIWLNQNRLVVEVSINGAEFLYDIVRRKRP